MWTGQNDAKKLRVDANFFENGEKKKVPFSNEYGYFWTGPKPIAFLPFTCPSPSSSLKLLSIRWINTKFEPTEFLST